MKFYTNLSCRLCWTCQCCETSGCDKNMYEAVFTNKSNITGHAPVNVNMKPLVSSFLHHTKAHSVTDSTGGYEPPGAGANPAGLSRGIDTYAVIMKVGQTTRVYMREPVTLAIFCDNKKVKFNLQRVHRDGRNLWACDIGPTKEAMSATITIDNQKIPVIITE